MKRIGFGQVEPNHLSAQRTAQIYAQLPANADIKQLENGQFVKYDYANGEVNFTGAGEWMLVFNEVKLYDGWRESYKDFAMLADKYTEGSDIVHGGLGNFKGQMVPRVFKTNIGDIFTTNCFESAGAKGAETEMTDLDVEDEVGINEDGFLDKSVTTGIIFQVVKVYTMPDGQEGIKLMRIK
jgi:hypothetical protein